MPSRRPLNDSLLGLVIAAALVVAGVWVCMVIDRHAEEHGHNRADAMGCVIGADGGEDRPAWEAVDGGGVHAPFFATGSVSDAVRRRRTGWDRRK